ncbi:MAG: sugar-binding domain-containing protein [Eubacteriales bacterium]|nr:sugar-binding domain-containing protein [Eubacteriales bacterium]
MKKIVDDWRLVYKVCSLYYEDDMRQQEVSDYLGISRATVSRMLQLGKESGIVRIEVINPVEFSYNKLEKALERKYGLKDVIVVEGNVLDTKKESASRLYERAALYLSQFFKDGDYIGVSMGHTLHGVGRTRRVFEKDKNLMFVPITGGISQGTMDKVDIQSNRIVQDFSRKFGGTYTQFLSPAVFSEKKVMEYFLKEKSVSYIYDDFKKLDTVVMGIGTPKGMESTLISAGYITKREIEQIVEDGAVGDIVLHFYDEEGNTGKFSEFNDRVAGMRPEAIRKVRNRIGIAGGTARAEAIKGAIRGGFINILVTNVDAAELLL